MNASHLRLAAALISTSVLSGCSVYSTAVNSLGPETALSDLVEPNSEYTLSDQRPLFCPAPECYMVLPEDDQGVIRVQLNNGEEYVMEGDYEILCVTEQTRERSKGDEATMESIFGEVVKSLPPVPVFHTVYFETDTTNLTAESQSLVKDIYEDVLAYPAAEIRVIGHTDTQGSESYNLDLSQRRAELVRQSLISQGVNPDIIVTEARGESDLLIQTADNVNEVQNRRVVINVR